VRYGGGYAKGLSTLFAGTEEEIAQLINREPLRSKITDHPT
jgi:hypothetical protein